MPHVFQLVRIIPPKSLSDHITPRPPCIRSGTVSVPAPVQVLPVTNLTPGVQNRLFCSLVCAKAGILCGPVGAWSPPPQAFLPLVLPVSRQEGKKGGQSSPEARRQTRFYSHNVTSRP